MYVSGPGLSAEGGQFPGLQFSYRAIAEEEYRIVRGAEDARMAVRENVTYGANVIKIYSSASPNLGYLSMEEMRAIVAEAHLLGVKVTAHATSDLAISRAVEAGVDSIEHGYRAEDATLKLMKERGVALVPTYLDSVNLKRIYAIARPNRPLTEQELSATLKQRYERIQRAAKAGVTIVAGSDNYIDLKVPQGEAAKRVLFTYHMREWKRRRFSKARPSTPQDCLESRDSELSRRELSQTLSPWTEIPHRISPRWNE